MIVLVDGHCVIIRLHFISDSTMETHMCNMIWAATLMTILFSLMPWHCQLYDQWSVQQLHVIKKTSHINRSFLSMSFLVYNPLDDFQKWHFQFPHFFGDHWWHIPLTIYVHSWYIIQANCDWLEIITQWVSSHVGYQAIMLNTVMISNVDIACQLQKNWL